MKIIKSFALFYCIQKVFLWVCLWEILINPIYPSAVKNPQKLILNCLFKGEQNGISTLIKEVFYPKEASCLFLITFVTLTKYIR